MPAKASKSLDTELLITGLKTIVAYRSIYQMWSMPDQLRQYLDFNTTNAIRLVQDMDAIDKMPEEDVKQVSKKEKAIKSSLWGKTQRVSTWNMERLTEAMTYMVYTVLCMARIINRMRKASGLSVINFYNEAVELDQGGADE